MPIHVKRIDAWLQYRKDNLASLKQEALLLVGEHASAKEYNPVVNRLARQHMAAEEVAADVAPDPTSSRPPRRVRGKQSPAPGLPAPGVQGPTNSGTWGQRQSVSYSVLREARRGDLHLEAGLESSDSYNAKRRNMQQVAYRYARAMPEEEFRRRSIHISERALRGRHANHVVINVRGGLIVIVDLF